MLYSNAVGLLAKKTLVEPKRQPENGKTPPLKRHIICAASKTMRSNHTVCTGQSAVIIWMAALFVSFVGYKIKF